MCEVQGPGAPGSVGGVSPPPERLSVSSSESEEDQKFPRHSLLNHSEEVVSKESLEGTSNSPEESRESEASKLPVETLNNMKEVQEDEREKEEEKEEEEKRSEEETETINEKMKEKEELEEEKEKKKKEQEKEKEESDSETKDVEVCVCDENEKENLENERRDELLENTVNTERETEDEKIPQPSVEENRRENDEGASESDSPKEDEPPRQKEEEKEDKEGEREEKEKEKEEKENKHTQEDVTITQDKEEEIKENGQEKKEKEDEEEEEEEGVDPFSLKCTKEAPTTHKVSKTVNFLESELKVCAEKKRHTLNSFSSSSSSSSYKISKAKEEGDAIDEDRIGGLEVDEKTSRHWTLGEGNPVYRLSLKLSPNLFNTTDIPGANQHKEAEKAGFLTKLSGRSFPYIAQWKRRYCVLSKGRLYYYEREDSKAGDKSNGVIQLEYFDQVAEAGPKECKKATNVFIITSQDRSFFDPGRHVFSADTLPDMKDWIRKLQAALDQIRNNNRPAASTSPSASPSAKEGGGKRRRDEVAESKEGKGNQTQTTTTTTTKERRKKKEDSSRPRKSSRVGVSSQTQNSMVEPVTCEPDGGRPVSAIPKGGVMLPGFTARKDPQPPNRPAERRSGDGEAEEDMPKAAPTLICVTKLRVKGPQGRRAPISQRRQTAAALKKRASSLSALEHQDASDNRSESSEGATRSYRDSQTPEGDLTESEEEIEKKKFKKEAIEEEEEEVHENTPERQFTFDNIDDGLFFKDGLKDMGGVGLNNSMGEAERKRRSTGLKVNFDEGPSSPSKNGTLGRFLQLKDSFVKSKRNKFVAKEGLVADHPDMMNNSRWSCVIL